MNIQIESPMRSKCSLANSPFEIGTAKFLRLVFSALAEELWFVVLIV